MMEMAPGYHGCAAARASRSGVVLQQPHGGPDGDPLDAQGHYYHTKPQAPCPRSRMFPGALLVDHRLDDGHGRPRIRRNPCRASDPKWWSAAL